MLIAKKNHTDSRKGNRHEENYFYVLIICLVSFGTAYAESEMAAYILKDYDCVIPAAQSGFPMTYIRLND